MKESDIKNILFKKQHDFSKAMLNKIDHTELQVINTKYVTVDNVKLLSEQVAPRDLLLTMGTKLPTFIDEFGMCPGVVKGVCKVHKRCADVVCITVNDTIYVKESIVSM